MLTAYIYAAMRLAHYEALPDDGFFGSIPALPGVWAGGPTLEACRDEPQEVLEDWMLVSLRRGDDLPALGERPLAA